MSEAITFCRRLWLCSPYRLWGECPMLNFPHSLVMGPSLLQLFARIALAKGGVVTPLCKRVQNPDIKNCALSVSPSEAFSYNVQSGTVLTVCSPSFEFFSCHRLQAWFCAYCMAHFTQEVGSDVSDFVVPDRGQSSSRKLQKVSNVLLIIVHIWQTHG